MKLIIVRHGQTVWNIEGKVQGHSPGKLTEKGIKQAEKLGKRLLKDNIIIIYSSDLKRAKETTEIINRYVTSPVNYVKELRERDYASYTGRFAKDLDWNNLPKDVETSKEMHERMEKFVHKVYKKHKQDTVLFSMHGRIGKTLVNFLLGRSHEVVEEIERLKNTAVTIFEIKEDGNHELILLNCTKHL